ncbi:MAG: sugar nucleotide-binding protein [Janthinobacterium sp.]|jgi:dTDP-4-dehydrorhamnose reductase
MTKILVIGYSGLVGSRFVELAKTKLDITGVDEKSLDITNQSAIEKYFSENKYDSVINFSAYTDVAGAEAQWNDTSGLCYRLNVLAPKYLSETLKKNNMFFVHFSTDFVFEGLTDSPGPFDEDSVIPSQSKNLSWYGWTKNRGEVEVQNSGVKNAIVRIANPFRSRFPLKLDFARKIIDLYDKDSLFPLFTDQIITPIFVDDLVDPLAKITVNALEGIFHLVSADTGTYFDIGSYILEKTRGVKGVTKESSLVEFMKVPGRNKRPIIGGLSTKKTQEKLDINFKSWRQMVDVFADQLKTDS